MFRQAKSNRNRLTGNTESITTPYRVKSTKTISFFISFKQIKNFKSFNITL